MTATDTADASLLKEKKKKKKKSVDPSEAGGETNGNAKEDTETVDKYDELIRYLSPISKPLASKKLTKKLYKLVRKSAKEKGAVRRGIRWPVRSSPRNCTNWSENRLRRRAPSDAAFARP